jgi:hypothetical protein
MGGGEHHEPFKVPHYSVYDSWKKQPELLEHSQRLQRVGLTDPFIRLVYYFNC